MNQPALEVADIFRAWAGRFVERSRARVSWPQHKVMRAIELLGTEVAPAVREEVATPKRGEHRADRLSTFDGN